MASETISHGLLKELATAGAIRRASAVAIGDRWGLMVSYGGVERTLAAANSHQIRSWANLNTLVKYVMGFGIRKLDLDATITIPARRLCAVRTNPLRSKKRTRRRLTTNGLKNR